MPFPDNSFLFAVLTHINFLARFFPPKAFLFPGLNSVFLSMIFFPQMTIHIFPFLRFLRAISLLEISSDFFALFYAAVVSHSRGAFFFVLIFMSIPVSDPNL